MTRMFIALYLLAQTLAAQAQNAPARLGELAAAADLVGVAQVIDTDYQYTRSFPSGGTAFLRMLIPYKVTQPYDALVQVYEEGLHEHECYFPNPPVTEEGRRYLVFLRVNPDRPGQYLGLPGGCALEMLVTTDNEYALRYPPSGIELADELLPLVKPLHFSDAHAVPDNEQLAVDERNELLSGGWLKHLDDGRFAYTHGIPVAEVRDLLGADNLTLERHLLQPRED